MVHPFLIMRWLVVVLTLLVCTAVAGDSAADSATYIPVTKFDPKRDAARDIHEAVVEAGRIGRHVLLDVGGEWCVWCHKLDRFFEKNADIREFLHRNYVLVKVNWSKENKNEEVLSRYPAIKGYPHLFVLDASGTLLHSQDTGELESGDHHDREKVIDFLKAWAPRDGDESR